MPLSWRHRLIIIFNGRDQALSFIKALPGSLPGSCTSNWDDNVEVSALVSGCTGSDVVMLDSCGYGLYAVHSCVWSEIWEEYSVYKAISIVQNVSDREMDLVIELSEDDFGDPSLRAVLSLENEEMIKAYSVNRFISHLEREIHNPARLPLSCSADWQNIRKLVRTSILRGLVIDAAQGVGDEDMEVIRRIVEDISA